MRKRLISICLALILAFSCVCCSVKGQARKQSGEITMFVGETSAYVNSVPMQTEAAMFVE